MLAHDLGSQQSLVSQVVDNDLCTACGACVGLCPYNLVQRDRVVFQDPCDRDQGRCQSFCPRTPTHLGDLRRALYQEEDLTPELGPVKGYYLCRAAQPALRAGAQHGGTVSALMALALQEGFIDQALLAEDGQDHASRGVAVDQPRDVWARAGSRFVVSPTLALFNRTAARCEGHLGVVATPCQALALAKMKQAACPSGPNPIGRLRLTIGLFCGWIFSWPQLSQLLARHFGQEEIRKLDIPPSQYHCLEVTTARGVREISLDELTPCIRPSCGYCADFTAEFADISVGSARLPQGWQEAKGWNQVLVRSPLGLELMEAALERGVLELREPPADGLDKLRAASAKKKRTALANLAAKSGHDDDLIYLDAGDPSLAPFMAPASQS